LLENHGVVTCGPDLSTAYQRMETVEQFARVMLTAEALGGPHLLPRAEVQKLIAARPRYGASCPGEHLELPVAAESAGERFVLARQGLKWAVE
jgi:Class II Aldolase and Adducin N-terminal domain